MSDLEKGNPIDSDRFGVINSFTETVAFVLLLFVLVSAILIHPSFFYLSLGSHEISVLSFLTPFIAVGTIICVASRRKTLKPDFLDFTIAAFMLFFLARNMMGPEQAGALKYVIYGTCTYYLARIVVMREYIFQLLVLSLVLITTLAVIYGFVEYAVQYNFLFPNRAILHPSKSFHRIGSSAGQPVYFAAILVQIMPYYILLFFNRSFWLRFIAIFTFIWAFLALILTSSKGSWIVVLFMSGSSIIFSFRKGIKDLLPILSIIAICMVIVGIFWNQISNDVSVRVSGSAKTRIVTWEAAARGIPDNFFSGVGYRQTLKELPKYLDPQWQNKSIKNIGTDNAYLDLLFEEGVIGFCLWLIMLGTAIVLGVKAASLATTQRFWAYAALASVTGFTINSFTFDAYRVWPNIILFMMSIGIINGVYQLKNNMRLDDNCQ